MTIKDVKSKLDKLGVDYSNAKNREDYLELLALNLLKKPKDDNSTKPVIQRNGYKIHFIPYERTTIDAKVKELNQDKILSRVDFNGATKNDVIDEVIVIVRD